MGATLLTASEDTETAEIAASILSSGERMNRMVNDLLDLTRTRLGSGIPVTTKPMDLKPVCERVIAELQAIHPDCQIRLEAKGDLTGEWDSDRLAQMVSNLVANALQYGMRGRLVSIVAEGTDTEVKLEVHNEGSPIPKNAIRAIFSPMARHQPNGEDNVNNPTGLGLGLFIASEIVSAHGGTIGVDSTEKKGTAFTIMIPRRPMSKNV